MKMSYQDYHGYQYYILPAGLQLFSVNSAVKAVLRLRTCSLGITWSKDENKMPSNRFWRQSEPSEVHSYNSYIHLYNSLSILKTSQLFRPIFIQNETTHVRLLLRTVLYAGQYLFIAVIKYGFIDKWNGNTNRREFYHQTGNRCIPTCA